jgi:MtN3 and saliva related transmembrane protein
MFSQNRLTRASVPGGDADQDQCAAKEAIGIHFLKAGSPASSRWRRIAEPLMVAIGIVQPLATLPLLYELYVKHSQDASGQSLTTWFIFAIASLSLSIYGLQNQRPAICAGNFIGVVTNLLMMNGILMYAR